MLNSIYEERLRLNDGYHISLTIPRDEYILVYGNVTKKSNAEELVNKYLESRDDDGDPDNINIYDYPDSNIINIEVDLNYIGNEHKSYTD
jgi:phosphomevalonate kinase